MQQSSTYSNYGSDFRSLEFPTFRKFFISLQDHFIPHARNNYHPHALSHRMLALLSLLLLTVKIASISAIALMPAVPAYASSISSESVITLANQARVENGLKEFRSNSLLAKAAQAKANDMLARQYFSHNTPDGATPWTFIKATGYSYITAGENLAIDFTDVETVQSAWMNSPGHRANILNKSFEEIGIGVSRGLFDGHQTTIVVQMFGTPIAQQFKTAPAPTPVTKTAPPTPATAVTQKPVVASPAQNSKAPATFTAPITTSSIPAKPATLQNAEALDIQETNTALQGDQLYLSVSSSNSAVKLLAIYGNQSVMLDPVGDSLWRGNIPLAKLSPYDNLVVQAYDINGNIHQAPVVQFSKGLNVSAKGNVKGASVTLLGKVFDPYAAEQKVFLVILAALLSGLVLAIAIKRHVQHVSLIANTSFVAMLAAILLMT